MSFLNSVVSNGFGTIEKCVFEMCLVFPDKEELSPHKCESLHIGSFCPGTKSAVRKDRH